MKKHTTILLGIFASATALHCGDSASDCAETNTCASSPDASNDTSSGGTDGGQDGTVPIPPGCDPNADPKDAPNCVVSDFGVFVDATTGNDGNSGSKELPMKSIGGALAKLNGRPRIYVCEGTYPESVKLTTAISIYGGFACGTWTYTGTKAKVAPTALGYALEVQPTTGALTISDVGFMALPGNASSPSSIAAFINSSPLLTLRRNRTAMDAWRGARQRASLRAWEPNVAREQAGNASSRRPSAQDRSRARPNVTA